MLHNLENSYYTCKSRLNYILILFLNFRSSEPGYSYRLYSYKKKCVLRKKHLRNIRGWNHWFFKKHRGSSRSLCFLYKMIMFGAGLDPTEPSNRVPLWSGFADLHGNVCFQNVSWKAMLSTMLKIRWKLL